MSQLADDALFDDEMRASELSPPSEGADRDRETAKEAAALRQIQTQPGLAGHVSTPDETAPQAPQAEVKAPQHLVAPAPTKVGPDQLKRFCGWHADYYLRMFERFAGPGRAGLSLNPAALVGGPYWAAARGLWGLFWLGFLLDMFTLSWALSGVHAAGATQGGIAFVAGRLLLGVLGNRLYWQAFCMWRVGSKSLNRFEPVRLAATSVVALTALVLILLQAAEVPLPEVMRTFPASFNLAHGVQRGLNDCISWMTAHWGPIFDGITFAVRGVLDFIERVLLAMPWPAQVLLVLLLAWRTGGVRTVLFAAGILAYLGLFGYWEKAISTMSLVAASVLICIVFGVPIGILCAKYKRLNAVANPVMDMMQTMPSFVYLLPAIAFFSIGKPPAVLATVVFAMPPVIKLTALGIRQIPENVKEAMLAFGASPLQLLIKAELPMAVSSIMTGVNQSIMMSLSMVVISALIGAGGLGYDVLTALQQMENGGGILAGLAIVVCAMLLDRIVQGSNARRK